MREIKFRAWDMYAKKWIEHFNVDLLNIPKFETCVIMQYTGLKDRNGNEIYEGDILSNDEEYYKVVFENASYRAEIEEYSLDLIDVAHCCEVIGNIYENPELLGDDE